MAQNKKPNILFITLDALRSKNLGCYGYFRNTSPNIDKLAKQGTLFKNAFSSNNATDKSIMSVLSGRHLLLDNERTPLLKKNEIKPFFEQGGKFLQEILKEEGYMTYFLKEIHSWQKKGFDKFYSMNMESMEKGLMRNIKRNPRLRKLSRKIVHYFPKFLSDKIKAKYGRDKSKKITEDAIKVIKDSKKNSENFFMWVYYEDTHIPYNPRDFTGKFSAQKGSENFFKKVLKNKYNPLLLDFWKGAFSRYSTIEDIVARYDSAIYFDDFLIGKIIDALKSTNQFDNTLIFLFSDHGESFYEHEIYFDHHGLYDPSVHIPLIAYGKGFKKNKKISSLVQLEDIFPTIAAMLNKSHLSFYGKDLTSIMSGKEKRDFVFMEETDKMVRRAIRTSRYKYIESSSKNEIICNYCNTSHGELLELYDLSEDPGELNNLARKRKNLLINLKLNLELEVKKLKKKTK